MQICGTMFCFYEYIHTYTHTHTHNFIVVFQSLSLVWLYVIPCTAACPVPLSPTVSRSLHKFRFMESWCSFTISSSASPFSFCLQPSPVQFNSVTQLCLTLCNSMDCSIHGLPVHHQLPEFTQTLSIEWVMPSSHLILCHPLLLLLSIFPRIRVFSSKSVLLIRWPKYWSFSFNIRASN